MALAADNDLRWVLVRFVLVGGVATFVHAAVVVTLMLAVPSFPIAINTIAFLLAFIVSGTSHSFYTFRLKTGHRQAIARWFVVSLAGLVIGNAVIWFMIAILQQSQWLALAIAIIIPMIVSFIASQFWAFKKL